MKSRPRSALSAAKKKRLDLVLTKLNLGGGDAFGLHHALRQMEHRCLIAGVTTLDQEPAVRDAGLAGTLAFVVPKPWQNFGSQDRLLRSAKRDRLPASPFFAGYRVLRIPCVPCHAMAGICRKAPACF